MTIQSLLIIMINAILTNNVILRQSWSICPFLGVSKKTNSAIGMGLAVTFVLAVVSLIVWPVNLLLTSINAGFMKTIVFILIIASVVQLLEIVIKKFSPALFNSLGIYLTLITTNCAVLLVATQIAQKGYNLLESVIYGTSIGIGFTLALVLMAGIRERIEKAPVPKVFKGFPIALIAACLMALAFSAFSNL